MRCYTSINIKERIIMLTHLKELREQLEKEGPSKVRVMIEVRPEGVFNIYEDGTEREFSETQYAWWNAPDNDLYDAD